MHGQRIVKLWWLIAGTAAVLVLGLLFLRAVSKTVGLRAVVQTETDFENPGLYIGEILPLPLREEAERVGWQRESVLNGWPVFIDVQPMAAFDSVDARLSYRAADSVRAVRFGVLANTETNEYITVPAARLLEELDWKKTEGVVFDAYDSGAGDSSLPHALGVSVPIVPGMPGYVSRDAMRPFHLNFRGHHRLLTYTDNEKLRFLFAVQDMNREHGADAIVITVSDAVSGKIIASVRQEDDGNAEADQKQSGLFRIGVETGVLERGVYQIDIAMSDDVFIRDMSTTQQKFVFRERVYMGDVIGYAPSGPATSVLVYGTTLETRLEHPRAVQTLRVGSKEVVLAIPFQVIPTFFEKEDIITVTSPKNEVTLVTDGVVGVSADTMFLPILPPISFLDTPETLRQKGVSSIMVPHGAMPMDDRGELVLRVPFDRMMKTASTGRFRFSVEPILHPDATPTNAFAVRGVGLHFEREKTSLWFTVTHLRELLDRAYVPTKEPLLYGRTYGHID